MTAPSTRRRIVGPALLAAALLLVAFAGPLSAADMTVKVTLDARGRGDVYMDLRAKLAEMTRFAGERDPQVVSLFLMRALRGSPQQTTELLRGSGFSSVAVNQKSDVEGIRTEITATISDVRPLAVLAGGSLDYIKRPGNYLELHGTLGGALEGRGADLSSLSGVSLSLCVVFPGSVREVDRAGAVSHAADSVTWRWSADRLARESVVIHASILPRIEGDAGYWLSLILGVTALVVVGAAIVLRHGRDARVGPRM